MVDGCLCIYPSFMHSWIEAWCFLELTVYCKVMWHVKNHCWIAVVNSFTSDNLCFIFTADDNCYQKIDKQTMEYLLYPTFYLFPVSLLVLFNRFNHFNNKFISVQNTACSGEIQSLLNMFVVLSKPFQRPLLRCIVLLLWSRQQQYSKNLERIMVDRGFQLSSISHIHLPQALASLQEDRWWPCHN